MTMTNQKKNFGQKLWNIIRVVHTLDAKAVWLELAYAFAMLASPYLNIAFLGLLLIGLQRGFSNDHMLLLLAIFLGARLFVTLITSWLEKLAADHETYVGQRLRAKTTEKLLSISYSDFESPQMREAYTGTKRGINMSGGLTSLLQNGFRDTFSLIISAIFAIGIFITLAQGHVRMNATAAGFFNGFYYPLTLVLLLAAPIGLGFWATQRGNIQQRKMIAGIIRENRVFGYFINFVDTFKHGELTRLYHADKLIESQEEASNSKSWEDYWRGAIGSLLYALPPTILINLLVGALFALIGLQAFGGGIAIGTVLIAVGYFQQFMNAFNEFTGSVGWYLNMIDYLQYFSDFFSLPDAAESGSLPVEKRTDNDFAISFHDVSFTYPGSDAWALRHVNLDLHIGERLAIVGPNGSGKTTLIMLLTRLYAPTEGKITLNDIDIAKYEAKEYESLMGVVFQDFRLFAYSISENVATDSMPDKTRVWQALDIADIKKRVVELPKTIDTPLTTALSPDGVAVSGGEAQKIAIARAWYKNAPVVILDEPTAALDPISEYEIYQRFDDLIADKTAIYISHRMSSTRFSQRIIVFNQGQIVQDGTHDSLMAQPGLYRDLFNAQAKYYTDDRVVSERANGDKKTNAVTG
ncbi:ABC transporter ATP-binding protein/permease [Oenococcus kitaharae]|uniref:ABC transporter ATP-binding protein n=3 Tax=Lactobacillaceae TaxID=33958 RepID=UPI0021E80245|nr:ABC transporter ATP-binding protein [Oenococcus kitaharae]MCV3296184.1 ABC transporter ATP-binding protein/permease [Oenococcus kitaharae]